MLLKTSRNGHPDCTRTHDLYLTLSVLFVVVVVDVVVVVVVALFHLHYHRKMAI